MVPQFFWWSGMWIFPVIGISVMLFVVYMLLGRGGFGCCRSWHDYNKHYTDNENFNSPLDILNKRYARGEISKQEFEQMKKDILS